MKIKRKWLTCKECGRVYKSSLGNEFCTKECHLNYIHWETKNEMDAWNKKMSEITVDRFLSVSKCNWILKRKILKLKKSNMLEIWESINFKLHRNHCNFVELLYSKRVDEL